MQEFMNFATVLIVAVGIAGCIGVMYASGLRLWAKSGAPRVEMAPLIICFDSLRWHVLRHAWS